MSLRASAGVGRQESGVRMRSRRPQSEPRPRGSGLSICFVLACFGLAIPAPTVFGQTRIGRPATEDKIKATDITTMPNGDGLPAGKGTVAAGKNIYKEKCATCHNDKMEGRPGQYPALVGGIGTINSPKPVKTVGSYWPYATTVFDFIRRAMPYDQPGSLKDDEIYSLVAAILNANGIIGENDEMNKDTLPKVKMPNHDNFVLDARPDVKSKR
jgi:S-disulfanyl-L-cysteine oxidoreductase SoxD